VVCARWYLAFKLELPRPAAAKRSFAQATRQHGAPRVITLDGYAASHQAAAKLKEVGTLSQRVCVRSRASGSTLASASRIASIADSPQITLCSRTLQSFA
jgi:transposase-like protein